MTDILRSLKFVDFDKLYYHEASEPNRLDSVYSEIRNSNVLLHPPLAVRANEEKYLIIDGLHRILSLKKLHCRRSIVQVVEQSVLHIDSWDHVVPGGNWYELLKHDPSMVLSEKVLNGPLLAIIENGCGNKFYLYPAKGKRSLLSRLELWHRMVNYYIGSYPVIRTVPGDKKIRIKHDELKISFPPKTYNEIVLMVQCGMVMPAGVTRFVIPNRILNLCVPLSLLVDQNVSYILYEQILDRWKQSVNHVYAGQ